MQLYCAAYTGAAIIDLCGAFSVRRAVLAAGLSRAVTCAIAPTPCVARAFVTTRWCGRCPGITITRHIASTPSVAGATRATGSACGLVAITGFAAATPC